MYADWMNFAKFTSLESRSASFENPTGNRSSGGKAASPLGPGRKGAAWKRVESGEQVVLADISGPGMIRHIWMTQQNTPEILRGVMIRIYWDGEKYPSVECPIGDFFGIAHGRTNHFSNLLQSMPEGSGMNVYFPMPFSKGAKIVYCNELNEPVPYFYYSVDYTLGDSVDETMGRFHCSFRRENPTERRKDFAILPHRNGMGRFLGCVVGIRPIGPQWWGEGEFKVYLDGDNDWPTIVGTGTEDYIGSAWGLGQHTTLYSGSPLVVVSGGWQRLISFYRFHIADPIFFHQDIRVEMQQIGAGIRPDGTNGLFERCDDWSAAAFWYQNLGEPLPPAVPLQERIADLEPLEGESRCERIHHVD